MAIKERESQFRPRHRRYVLHGLASPFSFFDFLTDLHLAKSVEQADAEALRRDWEIVGECIQDAMLEQSHFLESVEDQNND